MVLDVLKECPALEQAKFNMNDLVQAVIQGSSQNLDALEKAIAERSEIDGETAAGFMGIGAMAEVAEDLVGERAELVRAGRAVGRMMRTKFAEVIAEKIAAKKGRAS